MLKRMIELVQRGFVNRTQHRAYIVIGVLRSESGKGLGTKLLKKVNESAIKNEILKLELTVMVNNEKAFNLYKRMGFKVEGTRENSLMLMAIYVTNISWVKYYDIFSRKLSRRKLALITPKGDKKWIFSNGYFTF